MSITTSDRRLALTLGQYLICLQGIAWREALRFLEIQGVVTINQVNNNNNKWRQHKNNQNNNPNTTLHLFWGFFFFSRDNPLSNDWRRTYDDVFSPRIHAGS